MSPTTAIVLGVVSLAFLAVAYVRGREIVNVDDYFLASRHLEIRRFLGAYSGTNVTFTAVFLYLTAEGVKSGNIPLAAVPFWWAGVLLFWWQYPKLESFCKRGHTLHEYLGEVYSQPVRRLASAVTITTFVAGVSLEFYGFAWLMESLSGAELQWLVIGLVLLIVLVGYTAYGGFPATVATDLFQILLILLGVGILTWYALFPVLDVGLMRRVADVRNFVSDPLFLLAYLVLFVPFQFSVMDGWQRCVAAGGRREVIRPGSLLGGILVGFIFVVPVLLGISVADDPQLASDSQNALVLAIARVPAEGLAFAVLIAAFLSSLFSTADTLLLNAAYSLVYDLDASPATTQRASAREFVRSSAGLLPMRVWVLVLGAGAALGFGLLFVVPLNAFILAVLSSQAILGVLVLYSLWAGERAKHRSRGAFAAITVCFAVALLSVGAGIWSADQQLIDGAAFVAVLAALVVFFVIPRRPPLSEAATHQR